MIELIAMFVGGVTGLTLGLGLNKQFKEAAEEIEEEFKESRQK